MTRSAGDVPARLEVRLDEVEVSCDLVDAAADRLEALGSGAVNVPLPNAAARGRPSRGDGEPARRERVVPRLARGEDSVAAARADRLVQQRRGAPALLPGVDVADLAAVIASLGLVVGDIDK